MPTKISFVALISLLIYASGFTFSSSTTYAQSETKTITPLEQAKQDYSFQSTKYQEAHEKYAAAKNNYMAFKTAAAKNEAFVQTKQYVIQLHNVYITYLYLIDERSNLYDWGASTFSKDEQHKLVQDEVKNLEALRDQATKLTTLEETVTHTQKLEEQVSKKTLPVAYKLLVRTDFAQLKEAEHLFDQNAQKIDEYAAENIPENDNALFQAWQVEVTKKKDSLKQSLEPKSIEVSKLNPNLSFNLKKLEYEFSTDSERRLFTPTVDLLKEILNLL